MIIMAMLTKPREMSNTITPTVFYCTLRAVITVTAVVVNGGLTSS